MFTYTLISALAGDRVSETVEGAVELGQPAVDAGLISVEDQARLMGLPEVREFFAEHGYGERDEEVMYLAPGEVTLDGWPTLTVTLPGGA